jgi:hypothetical protein
MHLKKVIPKNMLNWDLFKKGSLDKFMFLKAYIFYPDPELQSFKIADPDPVIMNACLKCYFTWCT